MKVHDRFSDRFDDRINNRINPIFPFSGKRSDLSSTEFHGARN